MKKLLAYFMTGLCAFVLLWAGAVRASAADVTDLRWTARNDGNPPFVRLALDLSQKVKAVAALSSDGKSLEVMLKDSKTNAKVSHDYNIYKQNVDFATIVNDDGDVRLDVALNTPMTMKDIKVFALKPDAAAKKPHRLVVDIPSVSSAVPSPAPSAPSSGSASYKPTGEAKKVLKGKVIAIDPGHGGNDVGAIGQIGGQTVYEKDITLDIALHLRDMLQAAGAKVVMTRTTDTSVAAPTADDVTELQARCDVANRANADVFVSIHIDSFANGSVDGTTAYYYPKTGNDLLIAQLLHQSTLNLLAIPDRGVRSNDFYVNVHTNMPSTLMEMGFISNTHRVKMLTSSWGAKRIAESLYEGMIDYFSQVG